MTRRRTIPTLMLAVTFAVTSAAAAATPRLRRMVVVGDSLLAGFSSGGLVAHGHAGQVDSAPAFVARRAGVSLPKPLMSGPGVPPQLVIVDANGNGALDPGEVRRTRTSLGSRKRPIRAARNLAVPGEDTESVFQTISPRVVARRLIDGDRVDGRDLLKFLILGVPPRAGSVSQVSRAREIRPRFVMVWLGANDVLDMATGTDPGAAGATPEQFGRRFRRLLDDLADTGAAMAVANLPDVTGIAALRHAAGEVTSCRQADGSLRLVAPDDLLSIDMPRSELPVPPCDEILGPSERAQVRGTVMAFNAGITKAIDDVETGRGTAIAAVDMFAFFDRVRAEGVDLDGDLVPDVTTGYLGGLFSLDGIHPTRTGNALIANEFIDAINRRFGEAIPTVNVARVAASDRLVGNAFRPAGEAPFGLIAAPDTNDLEGFFDKTFDEVSSRADDLRRDVRNFGRDFFNRFRRFFGRLL
jgi:lysophospholipase L1-like esterase